MRKEYDFTGAKRAKDIPHLAKLQQSHRKKIRISIMLDEEVIDGFRLRAIAAGTGYQTEINRVLNEALSKKPPITIEAVRRVVRQELHVKFKS